MRFHFSEYLKAYWQRLEKLEDINPDAARGARLRLLLETIDLLVMQFEKEYAEAKPFLE